MYKVLLAPKFHACLSSLANIQRCFPSQYPPHLGLILTGGEPAATFYPAWQMSESSQLMEHLIGLTG